MLRPRTLALPVILAVLLPVLTGAPHAQQSAAQAPSAKRARSVPVPPRVDLLITNASVVDGSGRPAARANVGVLEGRIVYVGRGTPREAVTRLDARGLTLASGFIDVHTHADRVADTPFAENFVRMGVTTIIAGNCGASPVDIAMALDRIAEARVAVNVASLVGHNSVRSAVMGTARRRPTPVELDQMQALVARAMSAGALGLSTGLEYVPGTYAERDEIVALARVAGRDGGLYATHMRNEGTAVEEAIQEAIDVGEAAQCPVQISHLKIDSPGAWGRAGRLLALIDGARRRGVEVRADQYAYTAASTGLGIRFPSWALEGGGDAIAARLQHEPTWQKIKGEMVEALRQKGASDLSFAVVADYQPDRSRNGLSIPQIAARTRGVSELDAQLEVAREMLQAGGAQMVYHVMSDADVRRIMRHPQVAIASDASVNTPGVGRPHPRGYGNTARVLGHYVREEKVLTLPLAIRKMTALPAEHFGLGERGRVAPGFAADLVLFDARLVKDQATFEEPHAYPAGILHVLVNGTFVLKDGVPTRERPGQVLKRDPGRSERRPAQGTTSGGW